MEDVAALIDLDKVFFIDKVMTLNIAPDVGAIVVIDMIATKRDPVTFRDLGSASLPGGIEAINVVRPNAVVFDADILAVAFDADLAVVMNVGVGHATAGPDANPSTAVQTCLA